jgi:UDP-2,4-diacetamido-2,4,6-trideoxy-beta-L-altropyranose hydrolase
MRAAFRVDASRRIGTGHVMRCLVLADQLAAVGARCQFVSREHTGHLGAVIRERGHGLSLLPRFEQPAPTAAPGYADWLGTDWPEDARQTRDALPPEGVDWLVVDHYALDRAWEERLRPACRHLMVIDDLADRPHQPDLLLDQNLGREAQHYAALSPAGTRLLIGPRYALMRDVFSQLRERAIARRLQLAQPRHVLLSMGGVDADNVSGLVLDALQQGPAADITALDVVLGVGAPHEEAVRRALRSWGSTARLHVATPHMAELVADADVAIGAAGVSAWERCALGLPSLLLLQAENQRSGARALANTGAALWLGDAAELAETLPSAWSRLQDARLFADMQRRAADISDGLGAQRVASAMMEIGA